MESEIVDVAIVIAPAEDTEMSHDGPSTGDRKRASSRSSDSSPYITDSDGEDFFDAQGESQNIEKGKEKISRKSSMIKLTPELKEKIITQTEFLFSDENLQKDGFLLKHVKRNKDGFVNLKLLSSFKKMRSVCKDYRVICEALKDSKLLKLNEECTKIQRRIPLPDKLFDQAPVRFVVVSDLKVENPSMDILSDMFSKSGQIEGVRIIRPGKKPPSDLQSHFAHNPDLVKETVAVVEFETADLADEIVRNGLPRSEKFGQPKLSLLHLSAKQISKRSRHLSGGSEARSGSEDIMSGKEDEVKQKGKKNDRKKKANKNVKATESCHSSSDNDSHYLSFSSYRRRFNQDTPTSSPNLSPKNTRKTYVGGNSQHGTTPDSSPASQKKHFEQQQGKKNAGKFTRELKMSPLAKDVSPMTSPEMRRRSPKKNIVIETSSLPNSPWITRRKMYTKDLNENIENMNGKLNAFGLIRQPKGPDGTRGFLNPFNRIPIHA